jgi:hypothetical protein
VTTVPLPLILGDDWSWAFAYKGTSGAALDLTGALLAGELFYPYSAIPIDLTAGLGRVTVPAPAGGLVHLGLERAAQSVIGQPDPSQPVSRLQIVMTTASGLRRTIAIIPMVVVNAQATPYAPPVGAILSTDPLTGATMTFTGVPDDVPFAVAASGGALLIF